MRQTVVCLKIFIVLFILINQISATTILFKEFEDVVKQSPIIVDATVSEVKYIVTQNSMMGYALITLDIQEVIAGECPTKIEMRRYGITDQLKYIDVEYVPTFDLNERYIINLKLHSKGYYKHLGLYNGTFHVIDNMVKGNLSVDEFKEQIRTIKNSTNNSYGTISKRSQILARPDNANILRGDQDSTEHMNGYFTVYNETWDPNYLPVELKYNPAGKPTGVSNSTLRARINEAFTVWNNVSYSDFEIESITSSDETTESQEDNTICVIFWTDWTDGYPAREWPYPESPQGSGTKQGTDILFNTDYNECGYGDPCWHFDSEPPDTRNDNLDFCDILIHELGHSQGLAHTSINGTRMVDGYTNCTVSPLRTLADGDKAGAVYQHTGFTTIPTSLSHSIAISAAETSFNLTDNVTIGSGKTLYISNDNIEIDLDVYSIHASGGGEFLINSDVQFEPENVSVKTGSNLYGYWPSIPSGLSIAASGQTVHAANEEHIFNTTATIGNGVTLEIESDATINLNGYSLGIPGTGILSLSENVTFEPEDVSLYSGTTLRGKYSSILSALSSASSGQSVIVSTENHSVSSNLIVSSGITMEIGPGANLEFDSGKYLNIYGTLIAEGTSENLITFDKSGASDWSGIRFLDSSDDSECILSYCTIDNVSGYDVNCNRSNPTIENCTIQNATCGIYLYYPDASTDNIKNNVISNNSYGIFQYNGDSHTSSNEISGCWRGIYVGSGDMIIEADTVHDNTSKGIDLDRSDAILIKNLIFDNDEDGIWCRSYSDPDLRDDSYSNNVVAHNKYNGVYIDATSLPNLSGHGSVNGNSLYHNKHTVGEYYDVKSAQSSTVYAFNNWWGTYPPNVNKINGNISQTNPFEEDPNPDLDDLGLRKLLPDLSEPVPNDLPITQKLLSDPKAHEIFYDGYILEAEDRYAEALVNFKSVIATYPESFEATMALSRVQKCLKHCDRLGELESYLNSIYEPNRNRLLGGMVLEMQISILGKNKSFNEALTACETIINDFPESDIAKRAQFAKFMIHVNDRKEIGPANTVMDEYESKYVMDDYLIFMLLAMGEITPEQAKNLMNGQSKRLPPVVKMNCRSHLN